MRLKFVREHIHRKASPALYHAMLLLLWGLFLPFRSFAQTIVVESELDGIRTPLYGASVQINRSEKAFLTGITGQVNLPLQPGQRVLLQVRYLGFKPFLDSVTVLRGVNRILLEEDRYFFEEVVVTSKPSRMLLRQNAISTIEVTAYPLERVPRLLSEPDLIRVVQNLPGVKTETDFTGGMFVRGGDNDQNLILLDEVPVYNPWHLFGVFSAFNSEAVASVDLAKGIFPAQYGGRASSVLDIRLQEGSRRNGFGYLNVSPLSASFSYGQPVNQKTSVLVSIRRTYFDPLFWIYNARKPSRDAFRQTDEDNAALYRFGDYNFKLVHKFNLRHHLRYTAFFGHDRFRFDETVVFYNEREYGGLTRNELGWQNFSQALTHQYFGEGFYWRNTAYITRYGATNTIDDRLHEPGETGYGSDPFLTQKYIDVNLFKQRLSEYSLASEVTVKTGENYLIAGMQAMQTRFQDWAFRREKKYGQPGQYLDEDGYIQRPPGPLQPMILLRDRIVGDSTLVNAPQLNLYAMGEWKAGPVRIFPGLRTEYYHPASKWFVMPRLNFTAEMGNRWLLGAGAGLFTQYWQSSGFDLARIPTERWFLAAEDRPVLLSRNVTLGVQYKGDNGWSTSVETYGKWQQGYQVFSPLAQFRAARDERELPLFPSETLSGALRTYGVEVFQQKTRGRLTGWLGYTWSVAEAKFRLLSNGAYFPTRSDRRHDIQGFAAYELSRKWTFSTLLNFKSGQAVTLPIGAYQANQDPLDMKSDLGASDQVVLGLNNLRLPAYFRLDVTFTRTNMRLFRRKGSELSLSVYNATNHFNVLTVINKSMWRYSNDNIKVKPGLQYVGQIPILPMVGMRIPLFKEEKQ